MSQNRNGIVLVNKPPGLTSFETVAKLKRILGVSKIGHTGTLDKFAEGLMVVLFGKYTRLAPLFSDLDKEYIAEFHFGSTTETLDPEGLVVESGPVPTIEKIRSISEQFLGEIDQVPPLYSAVHHQGQRAYKMARKGLTPELKSRKITIYNLEILSYENPYLFVKVHCSKGTYIRSLARDIGKAADSCAYVKSLQRTSVGNFKLSDAQGLEELKKERHLFPPHLIPETIKGFCSLEIKDSFQPILLNGGRLTPDYFIESGEIEKELTDPAGIKFLVFNREKDFLAVLNVENNRINYITVMGRSER